MNIHWVIFPYRRGEISTKFCGQMLIVVSTRGITSPYPPVMGKSKSWLD